MIDGEAFLSMPPGLPFAQQVLAWKDVGAADAAFVAFFIANHTRMNQYQFRHALYLIQATNSPRLREVVRQYVGHPDIGFAIGADGFFQVQTDQGFISAEEAE